MKDWNRAGAHEANRDLFELKVRKLESGLCLSTGPLDGVDKNPTHVWPMVIIVGLVSRGEIKHSPFTDRPTEHHASGFGFAIWTMINAFKRHGLRLRNFERLALTFNTRQF